MVYIDPRDRKFQLMVILPIVLAIALMGFAAIDGGTEPELVAVIIVLVAILAFVLFVAVSFIQEKLAEREAESGGETE